MLGNQLFKCFWQEQCKAGDGMLQKSDAFALNTFVNQSYVEHTYTQINTHA